MTTPEQLCLAETGLEQVVEISINGRQEPQTMALLEANHCRHESPAELWAGRGRARGSTFLQAQYD
jgi:hypothetical protein